MDTDRVKTVGEEAEAPPAEIVDTGEQETREEG
jgi:hypothetical protein